MRKLSGVLLVIALLIAWELSAQLSIVPSSSWPSLSKTLLEIYKGMVSGELLVPWLGTVGHLLQGFALGSGIGITTGIVFSFFPVLYRIFNPIIEVIRPVPTPAIIPPLILLLGIDDALKITVISIAVFFPVFINTVSGVRGVSEVLVNTARTFRISNLTTMLFIILPGSVPSILAGLRTAIGLALVVTVVAEMTAGSSGFGYFIIQMQFAMRPEAMYASVIILSVTGYLLNSVAVFIERRLLFWHQS